MTEPSSPDHGDRVAPERGGMRSEQQEGLELAAEPPVADPPGWLAADPDVARESQDTPQGRQVAPPEDGLRDGMRTDREPTAIARDGGTHPEVGPEQQAVHIESEDGDRLER